MASESLWVFAEQRNGKLLRVAREVLSEGRRLANKWHKELVAVLSDDRAEGLIHDIAEHGADRVLQVQGQVMEEAGPFFFCDVFARLSEKYQPFAIFFGDTSLTRDFVPRLAARIRAGLVTHCSLFDVLEDGTIEVTRPLYGGKASATFRLTPDNPRLVLIPSGTAEIETTRRQPGVVTVEDFETNEQVIRRIRFIKADPESVDLTEAELIVSGGKGLVTRQGFSLLEELARLLGATVGGTRAAVDKGWIPLGRQVGQTGKRISPRFLITLGTSGAIQYTMGIESEVTVAVDINPRARIFESADVSIVADAQAVVSELISLLKQRGKKGLDVEHHG